MKREEGGYEEDNWATEHLSWISRVNKKNFGGWLVPDEGGNETETVNLKRARNLQGIILPHEIRLHARQNFTPSLFTPPHPRIIFCLAQFFLSYSKQRREHGLDMDRARTTLSCILLVG